ncbi:MAG: heat-inducible transcriptional repressor HrcA [Proteobacteria bacterium]|nr:heat-inducible transcriptional repressor HrcA [Pseudomonadota bacterium]MDA1058025.1 heat-inducible transcriptional repressor HrcA [Pseudomonadota bacterium]
MIQELSERNREVFRRLVEAYMETGEPVGSARLAERLKIKLSSATIRNVMADLQDSGLLYSPHTSAGRIPTPAGLSFFVDGLLEIGNVGEDDRANIDAACAATGRSMEDLLTEAVDGLSGLSHCAGLVVAPKQDTALRHVEFVGLSPARVLVVLVTEDGQVENRVIEVPGGWTPSSLIEATNYINSKVLGRTFVELQTELKEEQTNLRAQLDVLASRLIEDGLATWSGQEARATLIVRGRSNLLDDVNAVEDLERVRELFDALETKAGLVSLLDLTKDAEGVRIFIGSDSNLFNMAGCSVIVAPYIDSRERIIGAIGVIGPTRLNYARIIPMVDYTARVLGHKIGR